jgi:hypothetical protein
MRRRLMTRIAFPEREPSIWGPVVIGLVVLVIVALAVLVFTQSFLLFFLTMLGLGAFMFWPLGWRRKPPQNPEDSASPSSALQDPDTLHDGS